MAQSASLKEFLCSFQETGRFEKLKSLIRKIWKLEILFLSSSGQILQEDRGENFLSTSLFSHRDLIGAAVKGRDIQSLSFIAEVFQKQEIKKPDVFNVKDLAFQFAAAPILVDEMFLGAVVGGGFLSQARNSKEENQSFFQTTSVLGSELSDETLASFKTPLLAPSEVKALLQFLTFVATEVEEEFLETSSRDQRLLDLRRTVAERSLLGEMVGKSQAMQSIYQIIDRVRKSESPVLLQGENGTGKESMARIIHLHSPRAQERFFSFSCTASEDPFLHRELFGYTVNAHTGAARRKKGLFEASNRGTIFLDDVDELSPSIQAKIMEILKAGRLKPEGDLEWKRVDVRIIAATQQNLHKQVQVGKLREDLFYRLNVIHVEIPPLRARRDDIPLLVEHFLSKHRALSEGGRKTLDHETMQRLSEYEWPGNVQELENEIQRMLILSERSERIDVSMLSPSIRKESNLMTPKNEKGRLKDAIEKLEKEILTEGLHRYKGNRSRLSRELGVSRATLIWKVQKYNLDHIR